MSADHDHASRGAVCLCAHCMGQAEGASDAQERTYYVPDPPAIPLPPGSTVTTKPPEEEGYTGPRFRTLLRGDDWNGIQVGTPVLVPYTFATRALSNYDLDGSGGRPGFEMTSGVPLDAVQRASIREALGMWEQVSGITFIEVPDTPAWGFNGIRFMMESLAEQDLFGVTYQNNEPYSFNIALNRLIYGGQTLARGTDAFWTTLHEIGHAVGLKHPFEDDPVLRKSEDTNKNTVMSYTDKGNLSDLGPFDVAAVQFLYGTPEAEAAAPIRWFRNHDGSLVTHGDHTANTIGGLNIRDIVFAGADGDLIGVFGGDDDVVPGAGDDAVDGGAGVDTLFTGALRRQASVALGNKQGTAALPDGTDSFYNVEILRFVDGDLFLSPESAAGQAYRLYGAALGRAADPIGLSHWAGALKSGALSLTDAAAGFVSSPEFAGRYGAPDAAGFVELLYRNVLGRAPDEAGLNYWTGAMRNPAVGTAGVLVGFSESAENQKKTAGAFAGGLWLVDLEAADVLRAYVAVLDRLPDAGGLGSWKAEREAGLGQPELVARLVASEEFQARFGGYSNHDFVAQLYRTALDREADPDGLAAWTRVLDAGVDSRAGVAFGFASGNEMTAKITPMVSDGVFFG